MIRMRILFAGQTYYPAYNGQSIFTTNLAEGLAQRGHDVLGIVPSNLGPAYRMEHNGVQLLRVRSYSLSFWHTEAYYAPFSTPDIQDAFRTFRPEVVHIHDHYPMSHFVVRTARKFGIPVIGTNHFMPENLAPYFPRFTKLFKPGFEWLLWQWMLQLYNRLDLVSAPSRTAAAILRKAGMKVQVFPVSCGVSLQQFHRDEAIDRQAWRRKYQLDPDATLFMFVGRIDREKRLDILIEALASLQRKDLQLAIAGKGAACDELNNLCLKRNLGDRVRFLGFVPAGDLPRLLNSADLFAMPSEAELLSIATLEAMACGLPVLAANARALPELVTDGINGRLFKAGDAGQAALAIAALADAPSQWAAMSQISRSRAQTHRIENTLAEYEDLYARVLESKLPTYKLQASRPVRVQARNQPTGLDSKN